MKNSKDKKSKNRLSNSSSIGSISSVTTSLNTDKSNSRNSELLDIKNVAKWNVDTTIKWLESINYNECGKYFSEHKINGRALLMLDEDDLKEVIKHNVGERKNLYHLIRTLQIKYNRHLNNLSSNSFFDDNEDDEEDTEDDDEADNYENDEINYENTNSDSIENSNKFKNDNNDASSSSASNNKNSKTQFDNINLGSGLGLRNRTKNVHNIKKSPKKAPSDDIDNGDDENIHLMANFCENCLKKFDNSPYTNYATTNGFSNIPIRTYKGEKRKTFVSVVYLFLTCLWTSFMLTVVHDRVPDMQKYPPLPDIILDNIPLIPWAFFATEVIGLILLTIFLIILALHKYRSIIFRRMCSLGGTIFFLRSITMLITSLSVPGIHIQCSSQRYGSFMNKLHGAWNILSGVGLYVQGVRTCGDYMFSGHTVWLTLLTHFITEYTPQSMYWLHTYSWVLNIFGLFFILGAHEHYSIDVFVAFYITSRLFLYYHSLANNKVLFQRDHRRVKIWFPMLSYFESNIHSIVPNEYQYPTNIFSYTYKFVKNRIIKRIFYSNKPKKVTTATTPISLMTSQTN